MAVTTGTLTLDVGDLLAAAFTSSVPSVAGVRGAYIESNLPDGAPLVDTTGKVLRSKRTNITIAPDGTATVAGLVLSDSTGTNVTAGTLQYHVVIPVPGSLTPLDTGWFTINAANLTSGVVDLSQLSLAPTAVAAQLSAQLQTYVTAAAASASAAAASAATAHDISGLVTSDGVVTALLNDPASATTAKLSATFVHAVTDSFGNVTLFQNGVEL